MAKPVEQTGQAIKSEVEKYRKALAQDPDSRLFAALADALRRMGDVKAAISVAEAGTAKHPKYLSGIVVLAQAYFADQRFDDALELFKKVVKLNPENLMAHRAMAEIYDRLGDHDEALKAYRAITILDHTDKRAMERLEILEATTPRKAASRPEPEKPQQSAPPPQSDTDQESPPAAAQSFPKLPDDLAAPESIPEKTPAGPREEDDQEEITSPGSVPTGIAVAAPAAPGEDSQTEVLPRPEPAAAAPPDQAESPAPAQAGDADREKMSEEEKLDIFFSGEDLANLGIAADAEGFQVMGAKDALSGPRAIKPRPAEPAPGPALAEPSLDDVQITRSAMAKVFWNQGFRKKAIAVMAGEVCEKPDDRELRDEFEAACQAMGAEPDRVIKSAKQFTATKQEEKKKEPPAPADEATAEINPPASAQASAKASAPEKDPAAPAKDLEWFQPPISRPTAEAPAASSKRASGGNGKGKQTEAPSPAPDDEPRVPGQDRAQTLRKYLEKIRGTKENKT